MAPSFFVAAQSVLRGNDENSLGLIAAAGQAYPQYLGPADVRLGTDNGAEADMAELRIWAQSGGPGIVRSQ